MIIKSNVFLVSVLQCQWCDGRCSTGIDRKRQDWIKRDCEKKRITVSKQCSLTHENVPTPGAHKAVSIGKYLE